jgi:hypothetical protein
VLEVVGESAGGLAELDATGDGAPEDAAALAALGITAEELQALAALYEPGQELTRVAVSHFSGWCGGHSRPIYPPGATHPSQPGAQKPPPTGCPSAPGSIIRIDRQCLGERVELAGSPFSLHYESDRTPGKRSEYTLEIPATGATVPSPLEEVQVEVQVGGFRTIASLAPTPSQTVVFTWDGVDAYGRTLQGSQPVTVYVRYGYTVTFDGGRTSRGYLTQPWRGRIGPFDARGVGLLGFTLSPHHTYL